MTLSVALAWVVTAGGEQGGVDESSVSAQAMAVPSILDLAFTDELLFADPVQVPYDLTRTPTPTPVVAPVTPEAKAAPVVPTAPDVVQTAPPATGPVRGDTAVVQLGSAQERGRAALASLPYPYRELGVSITFKDYRGGTLGLFEPDSRRVTVYVAPTQSTQGLRVTIAHELGHALDSLVSTAATRRSYLVARGASPRTAWLPCGRCSDYASGAGDFAEVFALAVAGRGDFRSRLAAEPTPAQLTALAPFFRPPSERAPVAPAAPAAPRPAPAPAPATPAKPTPAPVPSPTRCGLVDALLGGC
jgi:hypothetical protein